jgi:hypothetical protein
MPMGNFSGPLKIPAVFWPWSMNYPHTLFVGWKQQKTGTASAANCLLSGIRILLNGEMVFSICF